MSKSDGWKGILPKFDAVHISTAERFVATIGNARISISLGDMGLWEVDVMIDGNYVFDEYLAANNMDHAIAQALALVSTQTTIQ
jgi:hypothetical protein